MDFVFGHDIKFYRRNDLNNFDRISAEKIITFFERKHLMKLLEDVLVKDISNRNIGFNEVIQKIDITGDKIEVSTKNRKSRYDVVIISEGIDSTTRELVFPDALVKTCPFKVKYSWFKTKTSLKNDMGIFLDHQGGFVIHPPSSKNLLGSYMKTNTTEAHEKDIEEKIENKIRSVDGNKSELDLETSRTFDLKEVFLKNYYKKNIVFIGDAAHGRPPLTGFGTTLAIEDAELLCKKLNKLPFDESFQKKLDEELKSFSKVRIKRIKSLYNFQNQLQMFMGGSGFKEKIILIFNKLIINFYMRWEIKRLATYHI